jgi:hypothetical protein
VSDFNDDSFEVTFSNMLPEYACVQLLVGTTLIGECNKRSVSFTVQGSSDFMLTYEFFSIPKENEGLLVIDVDADDGEENSSSQLGVNLELVENK